MNNTEPTWVPAEQPPVPDPSPHNGVANPTATVKDEEGKQTEYYTISWYRTPPDLTDQTLKLSILLIHPRLLKSA